MTNKDIGIEIAHKLIKYKNINNENYLPLVNKLMDNYNVNEKDRPIIMNSMIHEWAILGYDIISTHPFKLKGPKY